MCLLVAEEPGLTAEGVHRRLRLAPNTSRGLSARRDAPKSSGPFDVVIKVAPGEPKDLGDVRLFNEKEFAERAAAAEVTAASNVAKPQAIVVSGAVALSSGAPANGAHVAVTAMRN